MEVIVIDSKAYNSLLNEMREIIKSEFQNLREDLINHGVRQSDWITPKEAREMLGVRMTKYCRMKSEGAFVFSQFGKKVKVSRKSVEAFIKLHSTK